MNNLNAHAGSDRCKIASSAEKPSRNDDPWKLIHCERNPSDHIHPTITDI
jgi:hypothetical protein